MDRRRSVEMCQSQFGDLVLRTGTREEWIGLILSAEELGLHDVAALSLLRLLSFESHLSRQAAICRRAIRHSDSPVAWGRLALVEAVRGRWSVALECSKRGPRESAEWMSALERAISGDDLDCVRWTAAMQGTIALTAVERGAPPEPAYRRLREAFRRTRHREDRRVVRALVGAQLVLASAMNATRRVRVLRRRMEEAGWTSLADGTPLDEL